MIANHAVLIGVSIVFVLPILFMILTALMTDRQALSTKLIPNPVVWRNFWTVFKEIPLARYTWNTFLYAGLSTIGVIVSSVPVAYAFSRMRCCQSCMACILSWSGGGWCLADPPGRRRAACRRRSRRRWAFAEAP